VRYSVGADFFLDPGLHHHAEFERILGTCVPNCLAIAKTVEAAMVFSGMIRVLVAQHPASLMAGVEKDTSQQF